MNKEKSKAVLTIATGRPIYIKMAVNLARSFKLWHKGSSIRFTLVTDQKHLIPSDLKDIDVVEIDPGQYGTGFSTKLHLDKFATADCTLFIDADCLCVGSLEPIFNKFAGHSVSVVGKNIDGGDFFGDVRSICAHFGLPHIPCFVGGIYYIEKGSVADRVYASARELEAQYDQLGLVRLRNVPNEEPLMAIAMALHGQSPVKDDGSIKGEPMFYPSKVEVDVFKGTSTLLNLPEDPNHVSHWHWHLREAHPLLVHFHCAYVDHDPYIREAVKLEKVMAGGWPLTLAHAYAVATRTVPHSLMGRGKKALRPVYRKLFGTRRVKKSRRIA